MIVFLKLKKISISSYIAVRISINYFCIDNAYKVGVNLFNEYLSCCGNANQEAKNIFEGVQVNYSQT